MILVGKTKYDNIFLLIILYQQFIVQATPPPAPLVAPLLSPATLTCPSLLSTMMQKKLMSGWVNVSISNLDTSAVAFTDCPPTHDSTVVVEPLMSELEGLKSTVLVSYSLR